MNGKEVRGRTNEKVQVNYYMYSEELGEGSFLTFHKSEIESIVTKEQFENMEYKVK